MIDFKGTILCASKYYTADEILKINELGINDFGENIVQALLTKKQELTNHNLIWHFIGHLQTNKIKVLINEIDYLHSLASIKQADLIQKHRITPLKCFIQVNISEESSKNGISIDNLNDFINDLKKYDKIEIVGLMTIGILDDREKTDLIFKKANLLNIEYGFKYLSMGMTGDYDLAIKHNATHLRIGTYFKELIGG